MFETELSGGRVGKHGTRDRLQHAAIEEDVEWRIEEDGRTGGCLFNQESIREAFRSSTAKRQNDIGLPQR